MLQMIINTAYALMKTRKEMATFGLSVRANPGYVRLVPLTLSWIVSSPSMLKLQLKSLIYTQKG